jgi:hypothetical protein
MIIIVLVGKQREANEGRTKQGGGNGTSNIR